jgi:hypothetical protein
MVGLDTHDSTTAGMVPTPLSFGVWAVSRMESSSHDRGRRKGKRDKMRVGNEGNGRNSNFVDANSHRIFQHY